MKAERDFTASILETAGALIVVLDRKGRIEKFNRACEVLTGYRAAQVIGKYIKDMTFLSDQVRSEYEKYCAFQSDQVPEQFENIWMGVNRAPHDLTWTSTYLKDTNGQIQWVICSGMDITYRKYMEEALRSEKERLLVTLRSIGDGVISTDNLCHVVLMNPVAEDLTGWHLSEVIGMPFDDVLQVIDEKSRRRPKSIAQSVIECSQGIESQSSLILIARNGTERLILCSGSPIRNIHGDLAGLVIVFRDMTRQRKIDEELQKASKLDSVGLLAGGIAHDFNNILTAIIGNTSLAKMEMSKRHKVYKRLSGIEKASLQAKDLTQRLLTFSKGGVPVKKLASIAELIEETAAFALMGSNVQCELTLPKELWTIEADVGQINQVIHNLIINADQSMPDGGRIQIHAKNIQIGKQDIIALPQGKYVNISIDDHGVGISKEHLQKIFDPFFTTKQKGHGLGLAICYSIIVNHGGHIAVKSEVGLGTSFDIYLPACEKNICLERTFSNQPVRGRGRILVMDDDEFVRSISGDMLRELGYEVEFSNDGSQAIETYVKARESLRPFDAVIMDLTIPGGMGGKEAIKKLKQVDPTVKAIVSSGYSTDPILADFKTYGFKGVIVKPYEINELSEALKRVFNGSGT